MAFFTLSRPPQANIARRRQLASGEQLHRAGDEGLAWRLQRGVLRLDGTQGFASLAIAGDIVGCETLLFGVYTFSASALTDCQLSPWPDGDPALSGESLLSSLAKAQQRAAEIIALRGGQAADRVIALIRLLAGTDGGVVLPSRQAIADITDLRFETISRIVKQLERAGVLVPERVAGVHATRSFRYVAGH